MTSDPAALDLAWLDEHLERAWCSDLALSPDWTCERCGDRGHCACWHGACHFCGSKDHSGDTATRSVTMPGAVCSQDPRVTTLYLLACPDCGTPDNPLIMPFQSAEARGKWAADHTKGTGHDRWWVKDEQR